MTEGTRETKEVVDNQRIFSNPIALNSTKHVPSILSSQTVDKEVSSPQTISSQKIPWWKQAIAPMCLAVVGAGSFIISFRQSKRAARALNRELIDAAKQVYIYVQTHLISYLFFNEIEIKIVFTFCI